jgi:hypothetical protein
MDAEPAVAAGPGSVRPYAQPDLSTCLQQGRLALGGVAINPSRPDVEALQLAGWASAKSSSLAIVPIDPLTDITALLPAAAHVADMVASKLSGLTRGSRLHVAVVTRDYRVRGTYRSLQVRDVGGGRVPLRDVVPAATLGADGVIHALDSASPAGWSTIFVGSVAEAARVRGLDLVVVDLPDAGGDDLAALRVPAIIVGRDPTDPVLIRFAREGSLYAWAPGDLTGGFAGGRTPGGRLAAIASGSSCRVLRVQDDAIATAASLFWQDVGPLAKAARRSAIARELTQLSWGLFYDLTGLAMPTSYLEASGQPLARRLDTIERATRSANDDARDLYLPMTSAELRDIVRSVGSRPPKADALVRALKARAGRADVMLIARTAALARAYDAFLADSGLGRVRVVSLARLAEVQPAEYAVLTGIAPAWARWVYAAGVARELDVLAYGHSGGSEAASFAEAEIAQRAIGFTDSMRAWLARPAQRAATWQRLSGEVSSVVDDAPNPPDRRVAADVPIVDLTPPDVPAGLWGEGSWLMPAASASTMQAGVPDGPLPDLDVRAVSVIFTDGSSALLARDGRVTRFIRTKGVPDPGYPVSRLQPGDEVVFIDRDSRKDQLAKVLEVADQVPELAVASGWVGYWRSVLARAYGEFGTYEGLADALRAQGCRLQTQSIRLWVVGSTIGPEDPEDVRRLGLVAADSTIAEQHSEVCRAIDTLRRAHQRLGQRLGALSRHVGGAAAAGLIAPDEVIDDRSGLTAADFADSIDILTIAAIDDAGDVPFIVTGRVSGPESQEATSDR